MAMFMSQLRRITRRIMRGRAKHRANWRCSWKTWKVDPLRCDIAGCKRKDASQHDDGDDYCWPKTETLARLNQCPTWYRLKRNGLKQSECWLYVYNKQTRRIGTKYHRFRVSLSFGTATGGLVTYWYFGVCRCANFCLVLAENSVTVSRRAA